MSITNELLENKSFLSSTLKALVEQECTRVISAGLISRADCFSFIEKHKDSNDKLKSLISIYNALSNIKLAGDSLDEESFYDIKDVLEKIKEVKKDAPAAKACPCDPGQCVGSSECPCPSECECKNENRLLVKLEQLDSLVSNKLEKIAYFFGSNGDHETAYLVERTLKDVRANIKNGSLKNIKTK